MSTLWQQQQQPSPRRRLTTRAANAIAPNFFCVVLGTCLAAIRKQRRPRSLDVCVADVACNEHRAKCPNWAVF